MLKKRVDLINKWIMENPHVTDPNLYEIGELYIELGKEAAQHDVKNSPNKYPSDENLIQTYQGMSKMEMARKLDFESLRDGKNDLFQIGDPIIGLLNELRMRACIGEYIELKDNPKANEIKENLIKKLLSTGLYIKQLERDYPETIYDNELEMEEIEEMYQIYMTEFEKTHYSQGDMIGKPQFGYEMEPVMEMIREKYNYMEKENNPPKSR